MSKSNIAVAIFAGGKSTRFGSPKINAKVDGLEFGGRIIDSLRVAGFAEIWLIGGQEHDAEKWNIKHVPDQFKDGGPLGALITAMNNLSHDLLMTLPCDVPFIEAKSCLAISQISNAIEVRVARTDVPQWLCSTWRASALRSLESSFASGERAIHKIVGNFKHEFVDVSPHSLLNVNSPHDLEFSN